MSKLRRNILFQMGNLMEGTSIWVGLIISDYAIIYDVPTLQGEPFVKGDKRVSARRVTISTCLV